jgi:hypothetical protein
LDSCWRNNLSVMNMCHVLTAHLHVQVHKELSCNFTSLFIWYCYSNCSFLSLLFNPEQLLTACVILLEFFVIYDNILCIKFTKYIPLNFNTSVMYYVQRHDVFQLSKIAKPTTPSILVLWMMTEQSVQPGTDLSPCCHIQIISGAYYPTGYWR